MSRSFGGRPGHEDEPEPAADSSQGRGSNPQARPNMSKMRGNMPASRSGQPPQAEKNQSSRGQSESRNYQEPEAGESGGSENESAASTEMGKRLVAGLIDVVAGYLVGMVVNCLPFINAFIHDQLVLVAFLVVRDSLFNGRGVGKNLMGLQVIDVRTGQPASLMQSFKRNIVLFGPYFGLYIWQLSSQILLKIVPIDNNISSIVTNVVVGAGMVYTLVVLPSEVYKLYTRKDGRRWGDELAGTATVPADMDFSNPVSK